MALYTNDDFIKAAQNAGLYDQFSDADLRLAQQNPDFGMYALQMKQDYANATTPEARALANGNLETARMQMGGYTGGSDGSQFNPLLNNGMGNSQLAMSINQFTGMGNAPSFGDEYKPYTDQQMQNILNYKPFEYDATKDPLFSQYQDTYTREGQRAMQDTMGQMAARTGGLASSYAGSAAQQSYNQYMRALADKIPELYQQAYQRYADEFNRNVTGFNVASQQRDFDLSKYNAQLNAYNMDRNNLATQIDILAGLDNTQYQRDQAAMDDARSRIQQYLSLGGDISTLPADLLAASGMTQQELDMLAGQYAPKYYGGPVPAADDTAGGGFWEKMLGMKGTAGANPGKPVVNNDVLTMNKVGSAQGDGAITWNGNTYNLRTGLGQLEKDINAMNLTPAEIAAITNRLEELGVSVG